MSVKEKYADALADAEAKRELYYPFDPAARIEQWSRDGKAWRQISRQYDCEGCPDRDVMPSLGCACYVSCGGTE